MERAASIFVSILPLVVQRHLEEGNFFGGQDTMVMDTRSIFFHTTNNRKGSIRIHKPTWRLSWNMETIYTKKKKKNITSCVCVTGEASLRQQSFKLMYN